MINQGIEAVLYPITTAKSMHSQNANLQMNTHGSKFITLSSKFIFTYIVTPMSSNNKPRTNQKLNKKLTKSLHLLSN